MSIDWVDVVSLLIVAAQKCPVTDEMGTPSVVSPKAF